MPSNQPDEVDKRLGEIVGTFIALKFDVDVEDFSDGTLERWNNMKAALRTLLIEARIDEVYKMDEHYWGGEENDDDLDTLIDNEVTKYTQPRIAELTAKQDGDET